jgi:hypothetical protein
MIGDAPYIPSWKKKLGVLKVRDLLARAVLLHFSAEDSTARRHAFLLRLGAFPITIGLTAIKQHTKRLFK